jgi:hypothetical protein
MLPSTRFFAGLALGVATIVALGSLFLPVFVTTGPAMRPVIEPWLKIVGLVCGIGLGAVLVPIAVRALLAGAGARRSRPSVLARAAGAGGDRLVLAGWVLYVAGLALASPALAAFVQR